MNILVNKLYNQLALNQLTTTLTYFASKMQASSTQKTKDSAGKRLGYNNSDLESKFWEVKKSIQMTLLHVKEVSNGNQAKM
jgi:hypothetical protein